MGFIRRALREVEKRRFFAGDIIRMLASPVQKFVDKAGGTHRFLTLRAIDILDADGFPVLASWYRSHLEDLLKGNYWADGLWKNTCHHYDPTKKRGLFFWPSAVDQGAGWFRNSMHAWVTGDVERSVFFLGACLHVIQDVCQPYHSNCLILDGHQKYERWVDGTKEAYAEQSGGIYDLGPSAEDWIRKNARFSREFLSFVLPDSYGNGYHPATAILLSRAQRTTAGFLVFFMEKARQTAHEPVQGFFEEVLQWKSPRLLSVTCSQQTKNLSVPTIS